MEQRSGIIKLWNGNDTTWQESKNDFQTPPDIAAYMVSLLRGTEKSILEPTPGNGNIVRALEAAKYEEINWPDNYFLLPKGCRFDAVVMNPPFSHKFTNLEYAPPDINNLGMRMGHWFLTDCMRRSDKVVALMPWFTITDSDARLRKMTQFGLRSVTALPRKTFYRARIQTCILDLEKGYKGRTEFISYDGLTRREVEKQLTILEA